MAKTTNEKIKMVLGRILEEYSLGATSKKTIDLSVKDLLRDTEIDKDHLVSIVEKLKEKGLIVIFNLWKGSEIRYPHPGSDFNLCSIEISKDFKIKAEEYISELSTENSNDPESTGILYIDNDGNFWHGEKKDFCYEMGATSNRFKTLKYLQENDGYQSPREIAKVLGVENVQGVRTEIQKIRQNITKYLKLEGEEVLDSKKDSGYRINPKYKIVIQ